MALNSSAFLLDFVFTARYNSQSCWNAILQPNNFRLGMIGLQQGN